MSVNKHGGSEVECFSGVQNSKKGAQNSKKEGGIERKKA